MAQIKRNLIMQNNNSPHSDPVNHERIPIAVKFWKHVNKTASCWIWSGSRSDQRYGRESRQVGTRLAHRISWEIHYGPPPKDMDVCHHCDNPLCVRPSHLFIGKALDNMQDAASKNRVKFGVSHHAAKLNNDLVSQIRNLLKNGRSQSSIAREFKVTRSIISRIKNNTGWRRAP